MYGRLNKFLQELGGSPSGDFLQHRWGRGALLEVDGTVCPFVPTSEASSQGALPHSSAQLSLSFEAQLRAVKTLKITRSKVHM